MPREAALNQVLESIRAIHGQALLSKAEATSRSAASEVIDLLRTVCTVERREDYLGATLQILSSMAHEAIKLDEGSQYRLGAYWMRDVLWNSGAGKGFRMEYVGQVSQAAFETLAMMIRQDRHQTFKSFLSYMSSVDLPDRIIPRLRARLWDFVNLPWKVSRPNVPISENPGRAVGQLEAMLGFKVVREDAELWRTEFAMLREAVRGKLPSECEEADILEEELKGCVDDVEKAWAVLDVVFVAAAYALFRKKPRFIREIWTHTTPADQDATWINRNMTVSTPRDALFQCYWRGALSRKWDFHEDFHGTEPYLHQALLIWLLNVGTDYPTLLADPLAPTVDQRIAHYGVVRWIKDDLRFLLNQLSSLAADPTFLADCTGLSSGELERRTSALRAYLEGLSEPTEADLRAITLALPIDTDRIESFRNQALSSYRRRSLVHLLATVVPWSADAFPDLDVKEIGVVARFPRDVFTAVGPHLYVDRDPGVAVAESEDGHFYSTVLADERVARKEVAQFDYPSTTAAVIRLEERGFAAAGILYHQSVELPVMAPGIKYHEGQMCLAVGENELIPLYRLLNVEAQPAVMVLDRAACRWVEKRSFYVGPATEDGERALIPFGSVFGCEVSVPEAIEVILKRGGHELGPPTS